MFHALFRSFIPANYNESLSRLWNCCSVISDTAPRSDAMQRVPSAPVLLVRNHMVKFPVDALVMDGKWLAITTRQQQLV